MYTMMKIKIGISTCVYPKGLKRLLDSIAVSTTCEFEMFICMDGNRDYEALHNMPEYEETFNKMDRAVRMIDKKRLIKDNEDVHNYEFLKGYEDRWNLTVLRNEKNLGAVYTFNRLFLSCYKADIMILLTDDETVLPGWIDWQIEMFREFPNVVFSGYSNLARAPYKIWDEGPDSDDLLACLFVRGVYLRDLFNERGWLFNPTFKILGADVFFVNEVLTRGHDIGFLGNPYLVGSPGHHKSLGRWQLGNITQDRAHHPELLKLAVPERCGQHVYVYMNDVPEDTAGQAKPVVQKWKNG